MWYAVKIHYRKATFRCRIDLEHETCRVEDLKRMARTAWPDLVDRDIRLMYYDDEGAICPLIEQSWSDAVELGVEANPSKEWHNRLKLHVKLREDDDESTLNKLTADVTDGGGATGEDSKRRITVLLCDCEKVKQLFENSRNVTVSFGPESNDAHEDGGSSLTTEESWQVPAEESQ
ncbi:hypothetical protein Pmar_PMAR021706 [Perkinsus marinus ATCC 50983]|uniref:Uncharacterized protein n=1 Tax=Perkinsus marinus (strain ATCC 50983 / TXsc) TaxID=423536 RepID=C5L2G3_PERM5|nr:hypothetical protein Pmar_PMAR021706 [Perkinsus marinus ATCC 50983]EER09057.1 hypothetical protein Pmar_PMAR021706 [Perkinsus marinus ATCC 50983]|eukprot:XP_002777241.1 hypothetical protein Pmar_PMAR021706 [Perkinsus marinus ATCC 50983]